MTDEKLVKVLTFYEQALLLRNIQPRRWLPTFAFGSADRPVWLLEHALWMCQEAKGFVTEGRADTARHWLAFIQGVLWTQGEYRIEEIVQHNNQQDVPEPKPVGWYG